MIRLGDRTIISAWLVSFLLFFTLPVYSQDRSKGKHLYFTYCSSCHGSAGKGDGPAAKMLLVKPADHTQSSVMKQLTDHYLFKVISEGGPKVGKSSQMPGWGAVLKARQIEDIVKFIRSLSNSTAQADTQRR